MACNCRQCHSVNSVRRSNMSEKSSSVKQLDRRISAACSVAVLALASNVARATIVEPRDLEELVGEAEYIGSVWIEQSTSLSDDPTLKYPACGGSYSARTVDVVKGAAGRVRFYASEDLVVGQEYLVLLVQGLRSTTAIVSTTTLAGQSSVMVGKQKPMEDCTRRHPGLWSMEVPPRPVGPPSEDRKPEVTQATDGSGSRTSCAISRP